MANRVYETLVTKEDYLEFSGINLDEELTSLAINDLGDNPAPRFIKGIEDWCKLKLSMPPYYWDGIFNTLHQKNLFKEGILYQISYVLKNGNIGNDSGYNMASGNLVPRSELEKISMSEDAKNCFRVAGLMNYARMVHYD